MKPIIDALMDIEKAKTHVQFSDSDFSLPALLAGVAPVEDAVRGTEYAHYRGSLTTPHCNEVVDWIVFLKPLNISRSQINLFRKLQDGHGHKLVDNYRPTQPLNGRIVHFYKPAN